MSNERDRLVLLQKTEERIEVPINITAFIREVLATRREDKQVIEKTMEVRIEGALAVHIRTAFLDKALLIISHFFFLNTRKEEKNIIVSTKDRKKIIKMFQSFFFSLWNYHPEQKLR